MPSDATGPGAAESSAGQIEATGSDEWRAAIALRGDLDVAAAPALRAELERHLRDGRRVFRIDVAAVTFIDSVALGELIFASVRCMGDGGSLILTNVPPGVRRVVEITGLESMLLIDTAGERQSTSDAQPD